MTQRYWNRRISRRVAIRGVGVTAVGLAGAALIGCGDDDDDDDNGGTPTPAADGTGTATPSPTATATPSPTATATPPPAVKRGGIVKLGESQRDVLNATGMDPHTSTDQSGMWRLAFDPLVSTNPDGSLDPAGSLAEKWEIVDGTRIVFTLRQGVKFQDGTDFDAEAVRYNLTRAKDETLKGALYPATFAVIENIDAPDDFTVVFDLANVDASLLSNLAERGGLMSSPAHIEATDPDDLGTQPVGSGPYQLDSWTPEVSTVWKPFPDHWRKRDDGGTFALLDEIDLRIIPDPVVLVASLQSGEIDLVTPSPDQIELLESDDRFSQSVFLGGSLVSWWVNHRLPPADNVNFRKALMWAWDKESINDAIFGGRFVIADSLLSVASWAHKSARDYPGYDMEKAKELMAMSGVPPEDRVLVMSPTQADTGQALQAMAFGWEELGVRVETVDYFTDAANRAWTNRGQVGDVHLFSRGGHRAEPHVTMSLALTQSGAWNLGGAPVPEVEPLVAKGIQTYDEEERRETYHELQDLHSEHMYSLLPGFYENRYQFAKKEIGGLGWDHNGVISLFNLGYT